MRRLAIVAVSATACASACARDAAAQSFTPESEEVKRAVSAAVAYLEKAAPVDERLGAQALVGRVLMFQGKPSHPLVSRAVASIRSFLKSPSSDDQSLIYSLGLSLVFLSELDSTLYRPEIEGLTKALAERQKRHGGWGYALRPTGDTSMTQYAVYGLWAAEQGGVRVDDAIWTQALAWLTSVQDVGGGWPYQGVVPLRDERTDQEEVRRSMTEAGLASLYLTGNHFDVYDFKPPKPKSASPLLKPTSPPEPPKKARVDSRKMAAALSAGNTWLIETDDDYSEAFPHYHLYTIERFHSFRAAALKSPDVGGWYDAGVKYLLSKQSAEGSWDGGEGPTAATSFGVLFLIRSTRAALEIERLGPGTLYGGRGLPTEAVKASASGEGPGATRPEDRLKALLKNLDDPNFVATLSRIQDLQPLKDEPAPSELTKRLTELARGDSPEAKAAALRALGRSHDISTAPILIEAIQDPDPVVHQAAVDGQRYMSRDSDNFGKPIAADPVVRLVEGRRWWEWYRKIRPVGR